ncbi:RsmD family RNA methyltransferase [Parafrigoribacterium soli]|uniref:RsmD family RNA methyltransferase n=1 Tax=Parafrigoribacterium soli TaxID=3144663 RepID=UPI0032ED4583
MTRIIAGFAGSLTLAVPRSGTRPTSDRVREAIFSALESRDLLAGASVVDLYAGSGALGLEAASRGAASVTLVDNGQPAVRAARENARLVGRSAPAGMGPRIAVVAQSVQSFLDAASTEWTIALLDPPYELDDTQLRRNLEALAPRLAPDAVVLVERSSRSAEPGWPDGIELDRRKDYGDTTLWWARRS